MDSPDHPEPHPDDPWHPAWRPEGAVEQSTEAALEAAALDRIHAHVTQLSADMGVRHATETVRTDRLWREQVARVRNVGALASVAIGRGAPEPQADEVSPAEGASVPESGPPVSRGWFRRRRRRGDPSVTDVATGDEEDPHQVDDQDREQDESPAIADATTGSVEEPTKGGASEAASSETSVDDDFPWDDEDWSGAASGEDVDVVPLDLVAEDAGAIVEDPASDVPAVGEESPEDSDDEPEIPIDASAEPEMDEDSPDGADDEPDADEVELVTDARDAERPVAADLDDDDEVDEDNDEEVDEDNDEEAAEGDDNDDEEGRFSHAEVIPLIRPTEIDDEDLSAGLDPDLVAVAADDAELDEGVSDEGVSDEAGVAEETEGPRKTADAGEEYAEFKLEDYAGTATEEYAELARDIAASEEEDHELAAVSAEMPGIDTSLVSLDDVIDAGMSVTETISTVKRSDLGLRVATAIGLLAVFLGSLLWPWAIGVLILVVLSVAALELYIVSVNSGYRPLTWAGLVGVVGALGGTWVWGIVAIPIALGLTLIGSTLFLALSAERRTPMLDVALTIAAMTWIGVLGAPAFAIIDSPDYRWLILAIVLTTAVMDVAQYFFGRWLGRRPLAPVVSPKKTVEGLVGGVFAALVVGVAFGTIDGSPFDPGTGLAFGAMVAVVAPLGDLAVSVVKRSLGLKDMGAILPGHGGVLDRIDAMIFVIPSAWILFRFFDLLG